MGPLIGHENLYLSIIVHVYEVIISFALMPCVAREALDIHILSHFILPWNEIMPATPGQN
jgi:hypothetical protein